MAKMRLNLDQLQVESFDIEPVRAARGTVRGNVVDLAAGEFEAAITTPPTNPKIDCAPISTVCPPASTVCPPPTWLPTCPNTCAQTCPETCSPLCTYGCTESLSDCRFTGDPVCCV
jgi:hypothetical protein